ncbi:hypothetical protein B0H14DRAFT_3086036 [Mycena olivaceomarginata]|nr:hypothetical protein B0H14DRAFT_3086036 [Mycena olivaceomarginata]
MHKPSIHPVAHQSGGLTSNQSNQDGNARLRNRGTSSGVTQTVRRHSGIGSEPGINPRENDKYSHFSEKCAIQVTDFSSEHFVEIMKHPAPNPDANGAPAKRSLRWINIAGISWDVLSALALRYDLHTLALEDVLHEQGHNQSKADYYPQHLFLRVLCHSMPTENDLDSGPDPRSEYPGSWNKPRRNRSDSEKMAGYMDDLEHKFKNRRFSALSGFLLAYYHRPGQRQILEIAALKKGDRVAVKHEPMFIFLLREGTVISIRPTPNLEFTDPVTERINQHDSVIRTSEDPAILVEALLDLIVDRILEVMDEYQDKIHQLEHDILMKPGMSTVRSLHILSGDLIMHKRTLEPIKSMLYGLRRYDQDRYVYDHIDFVLTSLDMFSGISENLINYAFNMASYEMNLVMRRLTLATIIFLPLTLLTGYFGMNFTSMWSVNDHSDLLFWIIALPVMGVIIPMFLYQDIKSMVHYIHKVMAARRAVLAQERGPW